jgi:chaperone BCS1
MEQQSVVTIKGDDIAFKAIDHYTYKFLEKENENEYIVSGGRMRRIRDNTVTIYFFPKEGKSEFHYNDEKITIVKQYEGNPVMTDRNISKYSEIVLKSEKMETLKDFITKAVNYFYDNIMEKASEDDKIMCWIWDDFWEDVYKRRKRKLESISLNGKEKEILEDMKRFLSKETEEKYNLLGIPYKKNYLLEGLPGTGKTSLIYAIASELNLDVAILSFKREFDDVKFMKAVQHIPEDTLLILEDIDVLFQERKNNDEHKHGITFSGLLNVLDGLGHQDKLITIMTTNYKNRLDKALIRPGRIDYTLHFDYATKEQMKHMFFRFFPGKEEDCTTFLSYIKKQKLKLTTAILQQYLFTNMDKASVMDDINTLEELIILNNYQEKPDGFYN